MLDLLTKYLVIHRKVTIPAIGSFSVISEPARYDVADKVILPPSTKTAFSEAGLVTDTQLDFISKELKLSAAAANEQLAEFGEALKGTLKKQTVKWAGVGAISLEYNTVHFNPEDVSLLHPIEAPRVIHQDAKHVIRRGEDEFRSGFQQEDKTVFRRKKWKVEVFGWILLLLGILFIIFMAWQENFTVAITGLKKLF